MGIGTRRCKGRSLVLYKGTGSSMFRKIFEPGYIGKLKLKNRLVKSPTATKLATPDGCVSERMVNHYKELARGGVGLIIVEFTYVDEIASKMAECQLGASREYHRAGLEWLASTIKMNGAAACLQLCHAGNQRFFPGAKTVTAFPSRYIKGQAVPEELTLDEIREIVEAFGDAAVRAKSVGFDMVEIHGAHGYLITNSLSPQINVRSDCYGGSLPNRMRLLLEIIENIRRKVGTDYPLLVRLSGTDYEEKNPITIEETKAVAKVLEEAGISAIHVSGGIHSNSDKEVVRMYWPLAYNVWAAEEIKKVVSIPVIASGSITSAQLAEKILEEGKGDFIGLARPLLADPYFPLKAKEGRPEDINPCIRCCDGCMIRGTRIGTIACSVNVALGKEEEFKITPVSKPKNVAVVGGGPAGMEAARVSALMGHQVTLFEKRKLGGMLLEASVPEFKADLRGLIDYLANQLYKTGVTVVHDEAGIQTIKDGKFDAVIVATGGKPFIPDIPGLNKSSVVTDLDVLRGAKTGGSLVVVGGGMIGSDVALYLAEQGKEVTITTRGQEIARDMEAYSRVAFFERLSKQKVTIYTGLCLEEIGSGTAIFSKASARVEIKADSVVLSPGLTPNRDLFDELAAISELECYAVGDCVMPRMIYDAIHEGYRAASAIV